MRKAGLKQPFSMQAPPRSLRFQPPTTRNIREVAFRQAHLGYAAGSEGCVRVLIDQAAEESRREGAEELLDLIRRVLDKAPRV